jgi:hypothetical protein
MQKSSTAERILGCCAGSARAAAIMGDLTEMKATRGTLWFWTAFARTLFSLTWRIILALFVAEVAREMIFNLAGLYFRSTPESWRTNDGHHLLNAGGPMMACILSTLWFVLPFAAVRFGLRDRFVRLTFAIALGTTVAFLFIPWASASIALATVALAAAALLSQRWRASLVVLAGTGTAGLATFLAAAALKGLVHPHSFLGGIVFTNGAMLGFQGSLLVIAIAGSRLHRRLLESATPFHN